MKNFLLAITLTCLLFSCSKPSVNIICTNQSPQVDFALKSLKEATSNIAISQNTDIEIKIDQDCCEKGGFSIKNTNTKIEITANDANGLMYGIFELAEQLDTGSKLSEITDINQTPYIKNRGIKFNIPLDIRTSAFDDSGDAAQKNIANMWEFSFWEHFFNSMAKNRYNVIAFWNAHPFSSMVKTKDYPDVALEDVWGTSIDPKENPDAWKKPELPSTLAVENKVVLKKMSIDEKIAFWQKVMQHAHDRGIDIYFVTWNICLNGAAPTGSNEEAAGKKGKYGITNDYKNETSIDYLRKSVKEFLITYPFVKGIGVTAGENMRTPMTDDDKEKWLWDTYGQGILDAKALQPERKVDFIHRFWWTDYNKVKKYWGDYPDTFEMSFKYAKARLYSSPKPIFHEPLIGWMKPEGLKSWWNLRNDDNYIFRWGDHRYVSDFIKNLPYEYTAGYQMGSDGYVWGKEFISKNPKFSGQYEVDKFWYRFLLWGRLGYNPDIPEERFSKIIGNRFKNIDGHALNKLWQKASEVIPEINKFHWRDWDFMWQPEACMDIWNDFKDVNTFRAVQTMKGTNTLNITDYVKLVLNDEEVTKKTPLDVANYLEKISKTVLEEQSHFSFTKEDSELNETLLDIKSMGVLGSYYSNKIKGALALEFFKVTGEEKHKLEAIQHLENAFKDWKLYAALNADRYKAQNMSRLRTFSFENRNDLAHRDIELAKNAKTYDNEEKKKRNPGYYSN